MITVEALTVGHTRLERWGSPQDAHGAFHDWWGKRVVVYGSAWWEVFELLKSGPVQIDKGGVDGRLITFHGGEGQRVTVIGPQWESFLEAVSQPHLAAVPEVMEE